MADGAATAGREAIVFEEVSCRLCGSERRETALRGPDRVHGVPGVFTLCRCLACGLIYQSPRPSAASFDIIYPQDYAPYQPAPVSRERLHPDYLRLGALLGRLQPQGGRLLDIGCGPGTFLQALRLLQPRWSLAGIEPDARAAEAARRAGLDVRRGSLDDVELGEGAWDAITLWNVLEHLPDPLAALRRIGGALAPGGVLYLGVPMCDSWDARIFGPYWLGWELPRHYTLFSRATLRAMLGRAGFAIVTWAGLTGVEEAFAESLRLLIRGRLRSFALRRLAVAATYSRPLRLALRPYLWAAGAAGRCTVLTVAARRAP